MSIIADLIRAGVDPELVARVAEELDAKAARTARQERNARYYLRRKERLNKTSESSSYKKGSSSFPLDPPSQTLPPIIPQTLPPKRRAVARTRLDAAEISFDFDFANQEGLDEQQANREFQQFCDHHRKHGSLMADWQAAWRTWVRNAIKFQARAGPAGRSNGVRGFLENVSRMMADGTDSRTESRNGSAHQVVLGFPERRG